MPLPSCNASPLGLASVSFRRLSPAEVAAAAVHAGLDGIEWGGDIHCPPGDEAKAKQAARLTQEHGLRVLSYGSYYRLGEGMDFSPVLHTAQLLSAPVIRIWAGNRPYSALTPEDLQRCGQEVAAIAQTLPAGIRLAFEYHPGTATESAEGTLSLLSACAGEADTYWQMNPALSVDENLRELRALSGQVSRVHVFFCRPDGERCPLRQGVSAWERFTAALNRPVPYIFEFFRGDSVRRMQADVAFFQKLCRRT